MGWNLPMNCVKRINSYSSYICFCLFFIVSLLSRMVVIFSLLLVVKKNPGAPRPPQIIMCDFPWSETPYISHPLTCKKKNVFMTQNMSKQICLSGKKKKLATQTPTFKQQKQFFYAFEGWLFTLIGAEVHFKSVTEKLFSHLRFPGHVTDWLQMKIQRTEETE